MIADFDWAAAPLRSILWPSVCSCVYVVMSLAMHRAVTRAGFKLSAAVLQRLTVVHNCVLSGGSAVMFGGLMLEIARRSASPEGSMFLLCAATTEAPAGGMYFWLYTYYLSKYYELLDTPLQLARGKVPPNFGFQVYHHALVLFMAWGWLEYTQSLWQIGMLFNTAVHVVMYIYFLLCTLGRPPAWKRLVTRFQIVQFVTSVLLFAWTAYLILGEGRACAGTRALLANLGFNVTLLYQFVGIAKRNAPKKRA